MRRLVIGVMAFSALACGSGPPAAVPPPPDGPPVGPPPVWPPPAVPPTQDDAPAVLGDRLSVFEQSGSGCRWSAVDPVDPKHTEVVAEFDQACAHEVWMSWSPARAEVIVMFTGGSTTSAAWRLTILPAVGKPVRLPPAPVGQLEAVGFDGEVVRAQALPPDGSVQETTPGEGRIALTFEGKTLETDDYCCGGQLCLPMSLEGGAWKRGDAQIISHTEGTSPPWCDVPGVEKAGESGGHGEFGYEDIELPLEGSWGLVPNQQHLAVHVEWLEGQHISAPLVVKEGETWRHVEGFAESGPLTLAVSDRWFVACGHDRWRVYTLADAKPIGPERNGSCPALWVTAAG